MKFQLLVSSLFLFLLLSCDKEESILVADAQAMTKVENPEPTVAKRGQTEFSLCFEFLDRVDVADITPCTTNYSLAPITAVLPFYEDNQDDLIDELNDTFYCHPDFSTCLGAPMPEEICNIKFTLYDTKVFGVPDPVYQYFSEAINPSLSNQVMQYFACTMTDYGDTYYPDYRIAHVRFEADQILDNNEPHSGGIGDEVLLNAIVSYYVY